MIAETGTAGTFPVRLERFGRPETKNFLIGPTQFDPLNRDIELRDLYGMEDAFNVGETYLGVYHARIEANLAFFDGLDESVDWPLNTQGAHPLTELWLADFTVVDCLNRSPRELLRDRAGAARGPAHENAAAVRSTTTSSTPVHAAVNAEPVPHPRWGRPGDGPRLPDFPYLAPPQAMPADGASVADLAGAAA